MSKFFTCPNCGADVPVKALACPQCGSDDETGWSEEANYVHLLPDHDLPPEKPAPRLTAISSWNGFVVVVVAVLVISGFLISQRTAWSLYLIPVLIIVGFVLIYIRRPVRNRTRERQGDSYSRLLQLTGGNRERAERLIDEERRLTPIATRSELILGAIDHWQKDRG
jgi:RNA polymerase subunit RPABC4/transcription elongation factor Spt4